MMWSENNQKKSAFSSVQSWLPHLPIKGISVEEQARNKESLLNWYKRLIWLRKQTPALHSGDQTMIPADKDLLIYQRKNARKCYQIVLNFSCKERVFNLTQRGAIILDSKNTLESRILEKQIILSANQGLLIELPDSE